MKNKLLYAILASSVLTACGSDNENTDPLPETKVNTAPVAVTDIGLAQNNNPVTIDVIANDSDVDNDTLSIAEITTQPEYGRVEIVDGKLVYTPEINYAGVDTLTYTLTDGELSAEARVNLTVNHTMTLTGIVTDSPIADAVVTVEIGGETYTTTADFEGNYELPIVINDMASIVMVKAKGSEANNQSSVELVGVVGGTKNLLSSIDSNRKLANEANNRTNVTHVSTATYLLAKDINDNQDVSSSEQFTKLASEISPEELLNTAGFIKLLIDNKDFAIPEGESVVTLLESIAGENVSSAEAIDNYLKSNNFITENGELTPACQQALEDAIALTVKDTHAMGQFTAEMFAGKKMLSLYSVKQGWNQFSTDGWLFKADGSATLYESYDPTLPREANWAIQDGKLNVTYLEPNNKYFAYFDYPFNEITENYGFSSEVQAKLIEAAGAGLIPNGLQVEISGGLVNQSFTLLEQTDRAYHVSISGEYVSTMTLPDSVNWQGEAPTTSETLSGQRTLSHNYPSLFEEVKIDELLGSWVMNFEYSINPYYSDSGLAKVFGADKVLLAATSASTAISQLQLTSKLEQGALVMSQGEVTYKVTPIKLVDNSYLAMTEKWIGDELTLVVGGEIAKFDESASHQDFIANLVTELPQVHLAHINSHIEDLWDGDKLQLENIFGFRFNDDGTLNRGVTGYDSGVDNWDGIEEDHFWLGDDRWTWDSTDNVVNMYFNYAYSSRHHVWEVISTDELGRTLVLESRTRTKDRNNDGEITDDETYMEITPRINIIMKEDLSRWEDAWKNTLDAGLLPTQIKSPTANKVVLQTSHHKRLNN